VLLPRPFFCGLFDFVDPCFWHYEVAHFGGLFWPTPWDLANF